MQHIECKMHTVCISLAKTTTFSSLFPECSWRSFKKKTLALLTVRVSSQYLVSWGKIVAVAIEMTQDLVLVLHEQQSRSAALSATCMNALYMAVDAKPKLTVATSSRGMQAARLIRYFICPRRGSAVQISRSSTLPVRFKEWEEPLVRTLGLNDMPMAADWLFLWQGYLQYAREKWSWNHDFHNHLCLVPEDLPVQLINLLVPVDGLPIELDCLDV